MRPHRCSVLLAATVLLVGCAAGDAVDPVAAPGPSDAPAGAGADAGGPDAAAAGPVPTTTARPLVLVLPAPGALHPDGHAELLAAADRALGTAAAAGPVRRVVPPRTDAVPDVLAALAPEAGALCAVGAGVVPLLDAVGDRWAALPVCAVPGARDAGGVLVAGADVAALGSRLGGIARTVAGARDVVVLATGDPLLGADWAAGVAAGAAAGPDAGPVRVLADAAALDAAALAVGGGVGAVVLDAGPGAAAALRRLAGSPVPVLLPAALAAGADAPAPDRVAATYRVRWDRVLGPLLARARGGAAAAPPASGDVLEVVTGPAALPGPGAAGP